MEPRQDCECTNAVKTTVESKTKAYWKSKSIWGSTSSYVFLLTMISLYFKAIGHSLGETVPLVVLATGQWGFNIYSRLDAKTELTLSESKEV